MKPRLMRSALGDQVYIVTRYSKRKAPDGQEFYVAHVKYPVTEEELSAAFLVSIPREDRDADRIELVITREKAKDD